MANNGTQNGAATGSRSKLNKQFSGSQDSLVSEKSSIYSTASGVVATSSRKSLAASQQQLQLQKSASQKSNQVATPVSKKQPQPPTNQPVLIQSLKEKEGHIAQLLKERDFERAEFTRAAQKFEQTESKLIEYSKQLDDNSKQIQTLTTTIAQLQENKTTLLTEQAQAHTKIEDLEFQIEEHKLGCAEKSDPSPSAATEANDGHKKEDRRLDENTDILNSLKLQQSISKNQLEEIKFLKEEIDRLNIDLKHLRLGEEVYLKEKSDTKKQIDEIELQLNIAKEEANENVKLKEKIKKFEDGLEAVCLREKAALAKCSESN
jgi:hypothetical protein